MNYLVVFLFTSIHFRFLLFFPLLLHSLEANITTMKPIPTAHMAARPTHTNTNTNTILYSFGWQEVRANGSKENDTKNEHKMRQKSAKRTRQHSHKYI